MTDLTSPQAALLVLLAASGLAMAVGLEADVVSLCFLLVLSISGLLPENRLLTGFSTPAVATLTGLFVLMAALQKVGVVHWMGTRLYSMSQGNKRRLVWVFVGAAAGLSLLMNKAAVCALLLPAALQACQLGGVVPSRLLMPVAFAISLGAMATLFNSINLTINGVLENAGYPPLSMLEFFVPGGSICLVGLIYVLTAGARLLPGRRPSVRSAGRPNFLEFYKLRDTLHEVILLADSPLADRTIQDNQLDVRFGVAIIAIFRDNGLVRATARQLLREGDRLIVMGPPENIQSLLAEGLQEREDARDTLETLNLQLSEAMVLPHSGYIGKTLPEIKLRDKWGVTAVAIWRDGVSHPFGLHDFRLREGDALLLMAGRKEWERMKDNGDLLLLTEPPFLGDRRQVGVTIAICLTTLLIGSLGLLSLPEAMIGGSLALVASGVLSLPEAYRAIEWRVIVPIAAFSPLEQALRHTGLADWLGRHVTELDFGVGAFMIAVYLAAAFLTQLVGGQVCAVVFGPVVVAVSIALSSRGVDPRQAALAAAIGCNTAFLTQVSHPVNLLVAGPASYRPVDFFRVGVPLTLLCLVIVILFFGHPV